MDNVSLPILAACPQLQENRGQTLIYSGTEREQGLQRSWCGRTEVTG